ncbi:MAG: hypothetical protein JNK64_12060 [Myxococcales bacterium]|nr:hypothetical protein [Myxococcales bacterium]
MKWLALGVVAVLIGALLLLRGLRSDAAAAKPDAPPARPAAAAPTTPTARPAPALPEHPVVEGPVAAFERPEEDETAPFKVDSDEFYEQLDEVYSRRLSGFTHDCYQGGQHRKAKVRLLFRWEIKGGAVSVKDVRVDESTLGDPALEACMVKAVAGAHWTDARMPDWSTKVGEDERLLIRIENLKRFDKQP